MEQGTKLVKVSEYVIGRTPAYYEDEDNYVFTPALWIAEPVTKMYTRIDRQSEVYRLTEEGERHLDEWEDAYSCGYDLCNGRAKTKVTPEQMYEELTSNPEYSFKIR